MAEFYYNCSGGIYLHFSVDFLGKVRTLTWKQGKNEAIIYTSKNCVGGEKTLLKGELKRALKSVVRDHPEEAKDLAEVLQGDDAEQMRQAIYEVCFETNLMYAKLIKFCNP